MLFRLWIERHDFCLLCTTKLISCPCFSIVIFVNWAPLSPSPAGVHFEKTFACNSQPVNYKWLSLWELLMCYIHVWTGYAVCDFALHARNQHGGKKSCRQQKKSESYIYHEKLIHQYIWYMLTSWMHGVFSILLFTNYKATSIAFIVI